MIGKLLNPKRILETLGGKDVAMKMLSSQMPMLEGAIKEALSDIEPPEGFDAVMVNMAVHQVKGREMLLVFLVGTRIKEGNMEISKPIMPPKSLQKFIADLMGEAANAKALPAPKQGKDGQ